jgi:DNA-binding beta-propeller fold protein YncE
VQETLELGEDADNVRYDQQTGDIWVGYGNGIAIIDSAAQEAGSIPLGSHPESFQFEANGDQVYVNVAKQLGVAPIDRKKRLAVGKWGLGASFAKYPMALDSANKRLFVGCRLPARLVVLDTTSGRIVDTLPTVGDTDDVFYDARRRMVYVVGGDAYNIAELGVGTNDRAIVSGNILEDEKVLGTVHVALGNNAGMGGTVNVPIHLDGLIRKATLYVDGELLLDKGTLVISPEPDSR